jgi:hypothetical protein
MRSAHSWQDDFADLVGAVLPVFSIASFVADFVANFVADFVVVSVITAADGQGEGEREEQPSEWGWDGHADE